MATNETYGRASVLAFHAMGFERNGRRGRASRKVYRADEDPLAWWCLTEAIVALSRPHHAPESGE